MIITITQTIVIILIVFLLVSKESKKINKKIDEITIANIDLSNIENKLIESKTEILSEIKKINAGEIVLEDGKLKGNLFVDGDIVAKGDISAFDGGEI